MNDPLVLVLFLATWGGMVLLFRRLADDFRKAAVRQLPEAPPQIDEELLRITGEVQETIEGLSEAMGKRSEQLRTLIAEADTKIELLHAEVRTGSAAARTTVRPAALPITEPDPVPARVAPAALAPAVPAPMPAAPLPITGRATAADVRRLGAEGHDVETVARLTNRGREEVRILLGRSS